MRRPLLLAGLVLAVLAPSAGAATVVGTAPLAQSRDGDDSTASEGGPSLGAGGAVS